MSRAYSIVQALAEKSVVSRTDNLFGASLKMNGIPEIFDPADAEPKETPEFNDADHDDPRDAEMVADERASDAALLESLQTRMDDAQELVDFHQKALKELLADRPSLLAVVESYAAARARYIMARDSMERCGFLR